MKVGVLGASGYAGTELLRLCSGHPDLDVVAVSAASHQGQPVGAHTPALAAAYPDLVYSPTAAETVAGCDLVFLALPHGASQRLVPSLLEGDGAGPVVVDLGADFRLTDPAAYPRWYGEAHTAPDLLDRAVYGLPELRRAELAGARLVAVPGCYPTATALALAPLVEAGLLDVAPPVADGGVADPAGPPAIVVDAASGVSGAGRGPSDRLHFGQVDEDFTAYGLLDHRHTAEMEQTLGASVLFTPHLAPMVRGILVTAYARPSAAAAGLTTGAALELLREHYDAEPFVVVTEGSPSTKATCGSNCAHVSVRIDARTGWVVALAAIDNLVKGAAGQAVQCANLALGLSESTGLPARGGLSVSITTPAGFVAAGLACGIKASGALDLALLATDDGRPCAAAATFTTNKAAAPPVQVSRTHLAATGGTATAVVVSSGNANAATGDRGRDDAARMCGIVAGELGTASEQVLVCSTGLIGIPLPMEVVEPGLPTLVAARSATGAAARAAATGILTTDSGRKEAHVTGEGWSVAGMAKGAGMLAPDMATMLAFLTTDAEVAPDVLQRILAGAVGSSFNAMTVDGCTSTNDTVVLMASGRAGPVDEAVLAAAVADVCRDLAGHMLADAEGASRVYAARVTGAASDAEAHVAARKLADSLLVKCSINGADPYWGRVVSDLGSCGVAFDMDRVVVAYGGEVVCRNGVACPHDAAAVARHLGGARVDLGCDLGLGSGEAVVLGVDLGHGYIDENRTTS